MIKNDNEHVTKRIVHEGISLEGKRFIIIESNYRKTMYVDGKEFLNHDELIELQKIMRK